MAEQATRVTQPGTEMPVQPEHALALLRDMIRIRRFEEKCAELYSASKIRGFLHLYIGEEAVAVGAVRARTAAADPPIPAVIMRSLPCPSSKRPIFSAREEEITVPGAPVSIAIEAVTEPLNTALIITRLAEPP